MPRNSTVPKYRKRPLPQGDRAYVTLRDRTGRSRDYNLGVYNTPASREQYARLIAEWEAHDRRLPEPIRPHRDEVFTITQLCHAYSKSVAGRYSPGEASVIVATVGVLRRFFGTTPAARFGPNALRELRQAMVSMKLGRVHWSRQYINKIVLRIRAIFKWAVAHELLPVNCYEALRTIEPLRRGRSAAREAEPVRPAPEAAIAAVLQHVSAQVATMIELQLATGMRPGEVCSMRAADLDISGPVWLYQPAEHKTAWRGRPHTIYLGPKAQKLVAPYLKKRPTTAYLFSPVEAEAARLAERHRRRVTPLHHGNRPGKNCCENRTRPPSDHYTVDSYRRAITRACDVADEEAKRKAMDAMEGNTQAMEATPQAAESKRHMSDTGQKIVVKTRLVPRWHPHQLRHNYATNVRREYGLEAAQILLGHSSALITDAVYAERDMTKAMEIAAKIG